jgi:hypothetical protein
MSINGFRVKYPEGRPIGYLQYVDFKAQGAYRVVRELHTGTFDRNNQPIFEGDTLKSMTCEIPFKVESIVDFLMMCGEYKAKNGVDIFPSLEIINTPQD